MLKKILKYDIRELWRTSMPLFIASGIISVICCGGGFFMMNTIENSDSIITVFVNLGVFGIGIFSIVALALVSVLLSFARYYKSLFTDEGYLNMVIPVNTTTLINAKILAVLIWNTVTLAVAAMSGFIAVILPEIMRGDDLSFVEDIMDLFVLLSASGNEALFIIEALLDCLCSTVTVIAAITLGSVIIRKHKILGALLFYLVIGFIKGLGENITLVILDMANAIYAIYIVSIVNIVVYILITVAAYLGVHKIMNKKFNIE